MSVQAELVTCHCGREVIRLYKNGCCWGCPCPKARGKRNRKAGQAAERRRHGALGGTGPTPRDELGKTYSITVTTQDKRGQQIPASFRKFVGSEWFLAALKEAERAVAIGGGKIFPGVYLEPEGGGAWLVLRIR